MPARGSVMGRIGFGAVDYNRGAGSGVALNPGSSTNPGGYRAPSLMPNVKTPEILWLWVLIFLEMGGIGWLRHYFRRDHAG